MAMLAVLAAGQDNGGVIEVKNGDLHIDLQDAGGKVFISVKGGAEIELFDMAARLQALEIAVGEQNSLRDDFNELREKVSSPLPPKKRMKRLLKGKKKLKKCINQYLTVACFLLPNRSTRIKTVQPRWTIDWLMQRRRLQRIQIQLTR